MSKKTQRNGFYYFMVDFKKREEKNGTKFASFAEIQANAKCSKEWQELSPDLKKMYNSRAKQGKRGTEDKRTGLGESVKLIEKQESEIIQYELDMKESIDTTIKHAILTDRLDIISFYFIHVNWYYTRTDMNNVVDYIPAEFSVIEFSLTDGVKRCYHDIITPDIKIGYTREAMEHSDATHKIDIYRQGAKTDYKVLYNKFYDFVSYGDRSIKKLPPLYTSRKMKTVVPCFLERMTEAAGVPANTFNVYSLEYLFGTWMLELNPQFPECGNRASLAEAELDKDAFVWTPNIECSYHSKFENGGPYCSQSIVTQWVYTLCDAFCPILDIKMINGKHCPNTADSLVASMNALSVKVHKIGAMHSETGVSEAYRWKVGARTREENERRKKVGGPLKIEYGDVEEKTSIIVPSASSSVSNTKGKYPLRPFVSLSEVLVGVSADLAPNDNNFPALGSLKSNSRSKKK